MNAAVDRLEELKSRIRLYLPEYLREQGRDASDGKKFLCINPEHRDKNTPNCSIIDPDNPIHFYCFACLAKGDIFTAAHMVEERPITGRGFVTDNIYYLAEKYNIPFERDLRLTEEEISWMEHKNLYRTAYNILNEHGDLRLATQRGWTPEVCKEMGIASISSKTMLEQLFNHTRLPSSKTQYLNNMLFGHYKLTFTIKDEHGSPIAFAARDNRWFAPRIGDDGKEEICPFPKYSNSPKDVYNKRQFLYGLDVARRYKDMPLYVFEGYADVVTAFQHGIHNAVGTCGIALTNEHMQKISKAGFKCVRLCFDSDPGGRVGVDNYLKKTAPSCPDMLFQIVTIPEQEEKDNCDPDYFIRTHGKAEFLNLPAMDAFEWLLNHIDQSLPPEQICEDMIPYIAHDPRPSRWQRRMDMLSAKTGIRSELILKEVESIVNKEQANLEVRRRSILQSALHNATIDKEDAKSVLSSAIKQLDDIDRHRKRDMTNTQVHAEDINDIFKTWEDKDPSQDFMGWDCGFPAMNEILDGIPTRHSFIGLGALPSMGKTTLFANLVWNIVRNEEANQNLCVAVFTIDDSRAQFIPRLLGIETGLYSRYITFPKKYINDLQQLDLVRQAKSRLMRYISDGRLYVFDQDHGTMYAQISNHICALKEKHRERNILVFLDNMHKLSDATGNDERTKYKNLSQRIKDDVVVHDFTMVATMELIKEMHGARPTVRGIAETGQLEYDCNAIMLGHNELHAIHPVHCRTFWLHPDRPDYKMPVFELEVAKNKITGAEGEILFKMNPYTGKMQEATRTEIDHDVNRFQSDQQRQ